MILSLFSDEDTNTHEEERFKNTGSGDTLPKFEFSLVSQHTKYCCTWSTDWGIFKAVCLPLTKLCAIVTLKTENKPNIHRSEMVIIAQTFT